MPGVSTSSTDMVLSEEPDTTLITPLGTIALSVYGLFTLSPLPFWLFVMFWPADDSLFILSVPDYYSLFISFRDVPDV